MKNTGRQAPSVSIQRGTLHDYNLHPPMSGERLGAIIKASGLSLSAWLKRHEMHPAGTTRLRQMITGRRPVSPPVEAAAWRDVKKGPAGVGQQVAKDLSE